MASPRPLGPLYRHYPTRAALVEAADPNEIRKVCGAAAAARMAAGYEDGPAQGNMSRR